MRAKMANKEEAQEIKLMIGMISSANFVFKDDTLTITMPEIEEKEPLR